MKYLLVLTFFIVSTLKAESIPLPTSVLGVDNILQEVRGTLTTKVSALGKNYITRTTNQSAIFTSHEPISCNGINTQARDPLAKMQFSSKLNNGELTEKAIYAGCNGEVSLVEDVVTRGSNLAPLSMKDFLEGKRNIDLIDNEIYRLYKISNGEGVEIFKVLIEKTKVGKAVNYYFIGQQILTMNYEYQSNFTRLSITYYGYNITYKDNGSTWRYNYTFTPYSNIVLARQSKEDPVVYLDSNNNRISMAAFITLFNESVMKYTISSIGTIIEFHSRDFPKTDTVQTGAQSQRFVEELRIAQNRLLNNFEINLVKKLLQDYVDAAEKGLIIDNRPKN